MQTDYRNTYYCPELGDVIRRKEEVAVKIRNDHPRAQDMHHYISQNDKPYKTEFIMAYNGKCAYCGTSIDIIPKDSFEIDHFFFKESSRFHTKKDAGYMGNLVLACHTCNHRKSSFNITDEDELKLHPDKEDIKATYARDEMFYIIVNEKYAGDTIVNAFYKQLGLGDELKRLDYLLMSLYGLQRYLHDEGGMPEIYEKIGFLTEKLRKKRNLE